MNRPLRRITLAVDPSRVYYFSPETGEMVVRKDDPNVSPHWAFRVTPAALRDNTRRLRDLGIPVAGPYRHRNVDVVSIYAAM